MRVLVTGGAGFIGTQIVNQLLARGDDVLILDDYTPASHPEGPPLSPPPAPLLRADVRDDEALNRALTGIDVVVHQAAMVGLGVDLQDMPSYSGHTVDGTAHLLAAMARHNVSALVLASSMVIYGEGGYSCPTHGQVAAPPRREIDLAAGRFEPTCAICEQDLSPLLVPESTTADPRNTYAITKLAQEQLATVWARETSGEVIALRYHNVYGPGMPRNTPYAGVASLFRAALEQGKAPAVFEDGGQRRDFVHVDDIAGANVLAAQRITSAGERRPGSFAAFNVGSGEVRTIGDLATALWHSLGGPTPHTTGQYRLGDVRHITADSSRIRTELGWTPRIDFATGMAAFATAGTGVPS